MTDLRIWRQRREEIVHEVGRNRLARASRAARNRRTRQRSAPAWETRRYAGRLVKLLKRLRIPRRLP